MKACAGLGKVTMQGALLLANVANGVLHSLLSVINGPTI